MYRTVKPLTIIHYSWQEMIATLIKHLFQELNRPWAVSLINFNPLSQKLTILIFPKMDLKTYHGVSSDPRLHWGHIREEWDIYDLKQRIGNHCCMIFDKVNENWNINTTNESITTYFQRLGSKRTPWYNLRVKRFAEISCAYNFRYICWKIANIF